jgi:hypothetical protein
MSKSKFDRDHDGLIEYLDKRLGTHTGSGPEYQYYCPFCIDRLGSESDFRRLWINAAKGQGFCFRCEYRIGNIETFFRAMNNGAIRYEELAILKGQRRELPKAHEVKQSVAAIFAAEEETPPEELEPVLPPPETVWLETFLEKGVERPMPVKRAFNYLKRRGVPLRFVAKYSIGYCWTGDYAGYLVFPVIMGGEIVCFTTRWAGVKPPGDGSMKSKNPKKREGVYSREACLLNFDGCIGAPVVSVVEGPFDVMAHEAAVGMMGKAIGKRHLALLDLLAQYGTEEFVVSLDSDAGKDAENMYRSLLGRAPRVTVLELDEGDPWSRRSELPALMEDRGDGLRTAASRVKLRLTGDPRKRHLSRQTRKKRT